MFSFLVLPSASSRFPRQLPALPPLVPRKAGSTMLFRVTPPSGLPWSGSLRDGRTRVWLIHTSRPNNLTHWFQRGQTVSIIPHHHTSGTLHTTVISACGFSPLPESHTHTYTHCYAILWGFQIYDSSKLVATERRHSLPRQSLTDEREVWCGSSPVWPPDWAQRPLISAELCILIHGEQGPTVGCHVTWQPKRSKKKKNKSFF